MPGRRWFCLVWLIAQAGCRAPTSAPTAAPAQNQNVVIWISIDGLRRDYVDRDRARLPLLSRLMRQGAYTRRLAPVFPSLTFPSHVSQATGVTVDGHGVVSNSFYDRAAGEKYSFPTTQAIMQAQPIWITAPAQQVRTAVLDWPLSYQQDGPVTSDYFAERYVSDEDSSDAQRLGRLLEIWRNDDPRAHGDRPLRLLMGYLPLIDSAGHKFGPDALETRAEMAKLDYLLSDFIDKARAIFASKSAGRGGRLYLLLSTDHGMSPIHTQVNAERLLGDAYSKSIRIVTSGSIANIYLDGIAAERRDQVRATILNRLRGFSYVRAWPADALPPRWSYAHPARTGEVVATLAVGYTWTSKNEAATRPVPTSGPRGMHGYAVEEDPGMLGFALIACDGRSLGGRDLGAVDSLRLHPTVARLLGIQPAPGATAPPLVP